MTGGAILELWVIVQFDADCLAGIMYRDAGEQC